MADHRLDAADAHRCVGITLSGPDKVAEGLELDRIAHLGGGTMRFDQVHGRWIDIRHRICPLQGQALTDGVRRSNALALAIRTRPNTANDRIDRVTICFGIAEPLQHEDAGTFSHHKSISTLVEGSAVIRAQCPDLTEFHIGRDVH